MVARLVQRDGEGGMTIVSVDVVVEAPPERVWEVVSDPHNLSHWDRHVAAARDIPPEGLSVGARYATELHFMAVHAHVECEVLEWEPPSLSVIRLTGLLDALVTTTIEPLARGRSLLEHVIDYRFRGGHLGDFAARSLRLLGGPQLALRHGTMAQKREIESRH
jgi:uncharacterized protein YndB with AHSA1/START domain